MYKYLIQFDWFETIDAYTAYYHWRILGAAVSLTILFFISGCSYGTYYSTGSHANEDNSQHCQKA